MVGMRGYNNNQSEYKELEKSIQSLRSYIYEGPFLRKMQL